MSIQLQAVGEGNKGESSDQDTTVALNVR